MQRRWQIRVQAHYRMASVRITAICDDEDDLLVEPIDANIAQVIDVSKYGTFTAPNLVVEYRPGLFDEGALIQRRTTLDGNAARLPAEMVCRRSLFVDQSQMIDLECREAKSAIL